MAKYPIFLDLEKQRAVVVGGGQVAYQKTRGLLEADARVVVVTRQIVPELAGLCQAHGSEVVLSDYAREHLGRARVVIACTDDRSINETVYRDCQQAGILCNVVDTPDLCDFYLPAVVRRHPLQIAIGTEGSSPAFAKKVRMQLEKQFTEEHSAFLRTLRSLRPEVLSAIGDLGRREALLTEFADDESFEYFVEHGAAAWQARCRERIPTE
ncbi:MAG: bifunctional precorrin-2 dehydrogenase/sirohydrochlorin ferrochelatase [Planctomycetes bacterium]|nr:bifunctional precorrin-2 dehydrogenase/sirohydrochlorin ferrochelatase [Planctomycetota bacterium]